MIALRYSAAGVLSGSTPAELKPYAEYDEIRQIERASIRRFLETHREYLRGRVLDFGSGKQPYKDLIEGEYVPQEKGETTRGPFDAILCTQVVQYLVNVPAWLRSDVWPGLKSGGHLVLTYPTNWDEVESSDFWRFTQSGMEVLLLSVGFTIVHHERRAEVALGNFKFPLGYGVIARK